MLVLCLPTAFSETNRRSAIALLERPSAISARTSRSRAESLATGARTAAIPLANMAEIVQKLAPNSPNATIAIGSGRIPHPMARIRRGQASECPAGAADLFQATTTQATTKTITTRCMPGPFAGRAGDGRWLHRDAPSRLPAMGQRPPPG